MQNDLDERATTVSIVTENAAAVSTLESKTQLLAPPWHSLLIVLLAASASIAGVLSTKHLTSGVRTSNLPSYLASIVMEWTLAAIVLWGLHLRRTPLREVLGTFPRGLKAWLTDAGVALAFWVVALTLLDVLAFALQSFHLHPENIRATVSKLAPYSVPELIAWTVLSISAGICEEFIFRGYLQKQFALLSHRIWIGVLGSALVFGFAHGYEGWSGMLLITAFGALFSVLRLIRGNVRAGMMAHAWHDFLSGMVLSFIAHHKIFPLA